MGTALLFEYPSQTFAKFKNYFPSDNIYSRKYEDGQSKLLIGRSSYQVDLVLRDCTISRIQASVVRTLWNNFRIKNLSNSYFFVNGEKLLKDEEFALEDGTVIKFPNLYNGKSTNRNEILFYVSVLEVYENSSDFSLSVIERKTGQNLDEGFCSY